MRVYCNIHPQMVGFVMVVDSDFVDRDRRRRRLHAPTNVPAGERTLKVWHEEAASELSIPITVQGAGDTPPAPTSASTSRRSNRSRTRTSTERTTSRPRPTRMSVTDAHSSTPGPGATSGEVRPTRAEASSSRAAPVLAVAQDFPGDGAADPHRRRRRRRRRGLSRAPGGRRQDRRGPEEGRSRLGVLPAEPLRRAAPRAGRGRQQRRHDLDDVDARARDGRARPRDGLRHPEARAGLERRARTS